MNKQLIKYLDEIESDTEKYINEFMDSLEALGANDEATARRIVKLTRQVCDSIEERLLKSQNGEG